MAIYEALVDTNKPYLFSIEEICVILFSQINRSAKNIRRNLGVLRKQIAIADYYTHSDTITSRCIYKILVAEFHTKISEFLTTCPPIENCVNSAKFQIRYLPRLKKNPRIDALCDRDNAGMCVGVPERPI